MAKGYWVAQVDVSDMEQYKKYVAANAKPFKEFGARFLTRGGQSENPEGKSRSRTVVIEFPSYRAAVDCYHSADYQAAIQLRATASSADIVIIEGYDGIQPG